MTYFKRQRIAIVLIAVCAIIAGATAVYYLRYRPAASKESAAPKPALTVTSTTPSQTSLTVRLSANGNIAAWQEAIIGSEAAGLRLTEVRVNVGDRVKKGQVLAVFAPETVEAEVAQVRASLAEADATAADAAANAAKARTLQASGALSEQQINQYMTAEKTAKARLEAARANLSAQQVRLRQTRLLAPDDGIISARAATVGGVVGAGVELFRLIRGGRIEWRAEVTSAELGRITVDIPVMLVGPNGTAVKGKTRTIAPTVDPQTRSALVYVDLPQASPANPFKPGMFARGEFELGTTAALTVPQRAVVVRDGFNYVFRLGDDNRVRQVKVQTGRLASEQVEVSGLPADARIVVDGAGFLNDGDLVRVSKENKEKQPLAETIPAPVAIK